MLKNSTKPSLIADMGQLFKFHLSVFLMTVNISQTNKQQIYWYSHVQMVLPKITIYEITLITNM